MPVQAWECDSRPAPTKGLGQNDELAQPLPKGRKAGAEVGCTGPPRGVSAME